MDMKFRGNESFYIRKGWLHKGMKHVRDNNRIFVDKDINQMDELGIGANMVKSLRYWLQAVGLTQEGCGNNRSQTFTQLGEVIWTEDAYMEEDGTLCLLHYRLASNAEMATAWYFLFNVFALKEFSKEDFLRDIKEFIRIEGDGAEYVDRTIGDDFNCIINTYIPMSALNPKKDSPENNSDCPLGELNLLSISDKKAKLYRKNTPRRDNINPLIILAVILEQKNKNGDSNEIKISRLLKDANNVGKIFNLDTILLSAYLDRLQKLGYIRVIRTAGLDVIRIDTGMDFLQCVTEYYHQINS